MYDINPILPNIIKRINRNKSLSLIGIFHTMSVLKRFMERSKATALKVLMITFETRNGD